MVEPGRPPSRAPSLRSLKSLWPPKSRNPWLDLEPTLYKAAFIADQALGGRQLPEAAAATHAALQSTYELYRLLNKLRAPVIITLLLLPFFEVPPWCTQPWPHPCGDPALVPLSGIPYLKRPVSLSIELGALLTLAMLVALQLRYLGFKAVTPSHRLPLYKAVMLGVATLGVTLQLSTVRFPGARALFRVSAYLRVCIAVTNSRAMRTCVRASVRVLVNLLDSIALLAAFVLLSSWVATALYKDTEQGRLYFPNFGTTLSNMHVLLTTANNPDVWLPAYTQSRASVFFFCGYLLVGLFFLINFLLSAISDNYKMQLAAMERQRQRRRLRGLRRSFSLLDPQGRGRVDAAVVTQLLALLQGRARTKSESLPRPAPEDAELVGELVEDGEGMQFADFNRLLTALAENDGRDNLMPATVDDLEIPEPAPESVGQKLVLQFVADPAVEQGLLWALAGTFLLVIAQLVVDDYLWMLRLLYLEASIALLWVPEMAVKLYAHGPSAFLHSGALVWDAVASLSAAALAVTWLQHPRPHSGRPLSWLSAPLFMRCLRALGLLRALPTWGRLVPASKASIPRALPAVGLQLTISSLFCLLGVDLFGGLVYVGNPALKDTQYGQTNFYAHNYNDFASAMVTSFQLCVVNNWYVIADGYQAASGTAAARIFFVSFWALAVVFGLNLLVAFVVETFIHFHGQEGGLADGERRGSVRI